MARRLANLILILVCVLLGYASYDNVLRDNSDVKALAEHTACTVGPCGESHTMSKMDRSPIRESFEFTWRGKVVAVECGRPEWVMGERECHVMP